MTKVVEGSLWRTADGKKFRVLGIVETNGNTWVHYRNELAGVSQKDAQEYSCYIESFVERFTSTPD